MGRICFYQTFLMNGMLCACYDSWFYWFWPEKRKHIYHVCVIKWEVSYAEMTKYSNGSVGMWINKLILIEFLLLQWLVNPGKEFAIVRSDDESFGWISAPESGTFFLQLGKTNTKKGLSVLKFFPQLKVQG